MGSMARRVRTSSTYMHARIVYSRSEAMLNFQREVSNRLKPYIKRSRGNIDHLDQEIRHVAWLVNDAAEKTLPLLKPRRANRFRDKTLSQLCTRSKEAWRAWCREGRPVSGLQKISKYPSLHKIAECIGWKKLWDNALDHGLPAIKSTNNLVRVITYPEHSSRKCPLCDTENLEEPTLVEHVITYHTKSHTPGALFYRDIVCHSLLQSCFMPLTYLLTPLHAIFSHHPSLFSVHIAHAQAGPTNMNFLD